MIVLSAAWITACLLELLGFFEVLLTNPAAGSTPVSPAVLVGVTIPIVASTVAVGAVLVHRLPHHVIGWLLLAAGFSVAVSTGAGGLADYGLNVRPGSIPDAIGFAIISAAAGGPFIGLLAGFVPLYFPTGRLPSPRWWPVVVIAIIPTLSPVITNLFGPFPAGTYPPAATNPLALEGVGGLLVQGALVAVVRDLHEGRKPPSLGQLYDRTSGRLGTLVGASLLYGVGVAAGLFLLIVPGLIAAARWALIVPLVVIEGRGARDAFRRSNELVRGQTGRVLGLVVRRRAQRCRRRAAYRRQQLLGI